MNLSVIMYDVDHIHHYITLFACTFFGVSESEQSNVRVKLEAWHRCPQTRLQLCPGGGGMGEEHFQKRT